MTIFGWDMSHFDAPLIGTAMADGIAFVTHKAGGDRDDPELAPWWSGVKDTDPRNLLLGAYWVLYPGSPATRADAFLARLASQCPGWQNRPFILQADCEKWNGNAATVPSKIEIEVFCDRLVERMPKLHPIVYAPQWVYGNSLSGLSYPLWASSYVNGSGDFKSLYPGDPSSRWASYSGQTPAILQYSSTSTIAGQSTSDANAYRGTFKQLVALLAPGWSSTVAVLDSTDVNSIWNTDNIVANPVQRGNHATDPKTRAAFGLEDTWQQVYNLLDGVNAIKSLLSAGFAADAASNASAVSLLQQLAARPNVDETQLSSDLAAALIPHLPQGNISTMDLAQAILSMIQIKSV
jgi:hypothetical protein